MLRSAIRRERWEFFKPRRHFGPATPSGLRFMERGEPPLSPAISSQPGMFRMTPVLRRQWAGRQPPARPFLWPFQSCLSSANCLILERRAGQAGLPPAPATMESGRSNLSEVSILLVLNQGVLRLCQKRFDLRSSPGTVTSIENNFWKDRK